MVFRKTVRNERRIVLRTLETRLSDQIDTVITRSMEYYQVTILLLIIIIY